MRPRARKERKLAGPLRLTADGILKIEFVDDDDVIESSGVFTAPPRDGCKRAGGLR